MMLRALLALLLPGPPADRCAEEPRPRADLAHHSDEVERLTAALARLG